MSETFDIQEYMTGGVERVIREALRATLRNPRETLFLGHFAKAAKKASLIRRKFKENGKHVPAFLICSITSACNLHCEGCYSRHNHATVDEEPKKQLRSEEWEKVFKEAEEIGVSFILLAGGEPLLRRDVLKRASLHKDILFPVFTNGVYVDEEYFELFDDSRNLLPVLSIEGDEKITDERRGEGVFAKQAENMKRMKERDMIFACSITVTSENLKEVTGDAFLKDTEERGCKAVIFVEYVPVSKESEHLALNEEEQTYLRDRIAELRSTDEGMVLVAFPGDEKSSDGCIAAGRGFFHISSHGDAEPCPFSPYSDLNIRDVSLLEALDSRLFTRLRNEGVLKEDHKGGCVLFEKREEVERIISEEKGNA